MRRAPIEVRDPGLAPGPDGAALGRLDRSLCLVREPGGNEEPGWSEYYRPAGPVSLDRLRLGRPIGPGRG